MPDKAWKNRERLVAKFFGGMRNALSGINSKVTHSDVIHDNLFIAVSYTHLTLPTIDRV